MRGTFRFALIAVPLTAALVGLSGCGGHSAGAVQSGHAVTINYTIVGPADANAKKGSDGKMHDTFSTDGSTTVAVGDVVTISIVNKDDVAHGMFFPELGLNKAIPPATASGPVTTTFTFSATKAGVLRWYCPIPCDTDAEMWAMQMSPDGMGRNGFMAGTITVQ